MREALPHAADFEEIARNWRSQIPYIGIILLGEKPEIALRFDRRDITHIFIFLRVRMKTDILAHEYLPDVLHWDRDHI